MKYTYIVKEVKPDDLQEELCLLGGDGWELVSIIPISRFDISIQLNNQPKMKITYQLILKSEIDE